MVTREGLGPLFERTLAQATAGDSAAFEKLYATYAGRMKAFALTRRSGDADALANDVMLRVFQNLSSFRGDEDAFVRWMFTIARNRLIDLHRTATRRPEIADVDVPDHDLPSAESVAMGQLDTHAVVALLQRLTFAQREVIALRLIEDLSIADVSEIVGRPETAVKALQRRGLRRLQQIILEETVS